MVDEQNSVKKQPPKKQKCHKKRKGRLSINVGLCKYDVVRDVAKSIFKMKVVEDETTEDCDIIWSDNGMAAEQLYKLKPY
jgi:hypothetical protein